MNNETPEIAKRSKATDYITFIVVVSAICGVDAAYERMLLVLVPGKRYYWFSANYY
jgi:hypothetical protein